MIQLERQGVPRWVAAGGVLAKYRLRYVPPESDDGLRIQQARARVNAVMQMYGLPMTKAGYVRAMFWPYPPTFPIPSNVIGAISEAPGPVPTRMKDVLFGRSALFNLVNIAAVEDVIRIIDGGLLRRQRRVCTARGRGHMWLELKMVTFARGPEFYCGFCLVVKLAGFYGWPIPPADD